MTTLPAQGLDPWYNSFVLWAQTAHNTDGTLKVTALADQTAAFPAGSKIAKNDTAFAATGLRFSATAYGVKGDNTNGTATANQTAMAACLAAAAAAGEGSVVELDWPGTAYFNGDLPIDTRLHYQGNGFNKSKLANTRAAGTHVWKTRNFSTLTQTLIASFNVGEWEFTFTSHWIDGNKANNTTGGHCLAIVGYGYRLDLLTLEGAHSAGWWSEYNLSGEPIGSGGSQHERAFHAGRILCINNDCANVAAANTRSSQGKAALTGGQAALWGPGDSHIAYFEAYRDGSVSGIGFNQGLIDFNSGSFSSFNIVIDVLVVWLNHNKGAYFAGGAPSIGYVHAEGANTNLEIDCQGPRIVNGRLFFTQASGTSLKITSGGNGGYIALSLENDFAAGVTKINVAGGTCVHAVLDFYLDIGSAVTVTLTAGSLPTGARRVTISAFNYGTATVTAGWLPLLTGSTTQYGINWNLPPTINGFFTKSGAPSTTDIPAGMYAVYKDSSGGSIKLYANDGGVIKSVTLT